MATDIKLRDIVWVGPPGDPLRKATWEVVALFEDVDGVQQATLRSGRTGRYATHPVAILTPYRVRVMEPAA